MAGCMLRMYTETSVGTLSIFSVDFCGKHLKKEGN
jgi:hypothetical protein